VTVVAVVVGVAAVAAVAALVIVQRRLGARLREAAQRLDGDATASGSSIHEAVSAMERAVERTVTRGDRVSQAEARFGSALHAVPQGILIYDEAGELVYSNEIGAGFVAARPSEALVEEAIAGLSQAGIEGHEENRVVDLFGPPRRTLELRVAPLRGPARTPLGALVVIDDVSERRRLENVRRDFVANISHELKTPVGALGLLAETLLAEDDRDLVRRLAERLHDEAFRVGRTIDDLLELSQIEASERDRFDAIPVDLVVAEAVERVRPAAEQQGIEIAVDELHPRLTVVGDRRQLVSAIYNLLENAVKYSDRGALVAVRALTDGSSVDIAVADHGIGIPQRDLERVFERFYRVDRARSRETGGTGLGLAIVRHVASNHGGEVRVTSREGEGSTFTLRLPAGPGPVAVTIEPPQEESA
jgi:two-component system sensor histidine kinase SenX3